MSLIDLRVPEEGKTIIVNVDHIQERVIVPMQRIIWYLHGWERGPVVVTDRESILVFAMNKRQLHTISLSDPLQPTYVMHQINNVFVEGGKVGVDIVFSPRAAIQSVSDVPGERWLDVLTLSGVHSPTHQRMLALRD